MLFSVLFQVFFALGFACFLCVIVVFCVLGLFFLPSRAGRRLVSQSVNQSVGQEMFAKSCFFKCYSVTVPFPLFSVCFYLLMFYLFPLEETDASSNLDQVCIGKLYLEQELLNNQTQIIHENLLN